MSGSYPHARMCLRVVMSARCSARTRSSADGEVVSLNPAAVSSEVDRFEALVREGSRDVVDCGGVILLRFPGRRRCGQRGALEGMADRWAREAAGGHPWRPVELGLEDQDPSARRVRS